MRRFSVHRIIEESYPLLPLTLNTNGYSTIVGFPFLAAGKRQYLMALWTQFSTFALRIVVSFLMTFWTSPCGEMIQTKTTRPFNPLILLRTEEA